MTFAVVAVVGAGTALVGGAMQSSAARKASKAQVQAANDANASNERIFRMQQEAQEPFRRAGITGQDEYMRLLGLAGDPDSEGYGQYASAAMPANWQDDLIDPGYNFRFREGQDAIEASAAARGGYLSGNLMKNLTRYGQDMGSQEYQNAFNRYQTTRTNTLNPFGTLAGVGQTAANNVTNAAGEMGARNGENITGAGNARASGYVGSANAWAGALGGVANAGLGYAANNQMSRYMAQMGRG